LRRPFRGAALAAAIVLLLAVGLNAALFAGARAERARLGEARSGVPNVLLIIWDTVRAESLSLYGYNLPTTPNLERLAAGGVSFTKAISTSPWTLPAHASLFTGRLPHETSAAWYAPLDGTHATLAERLGADGWATAGFAANNLYVDWEHGLARGFVHFEDYRVTPGQVMLASSIGERILTGGGGWTPGLLRTLLGHHHKFIGRKWADQVNSALLDWLDAKEPDRPFFAFLNYFDAHLPYDPPAPFDTMFGPPRRTTTFTERLRNVWEGHGKWDLSDEDLAAEVRAYEASIAYLDDRLGRLIDSLSERGLLENTLVVLTSDHGEEFGEHGSFEHGGNLYFEQTHVPLVISWPGRLPEGMVIDTPVSIQDVPATIDRLARNDARRTFPGASLTRFWDASGSPLASPVVAELVPGREPDERMTSIIAAGFQYIADTDSAIDLYDVKKDWSELNDLASTPGADTIVERVRVSAESFTACDSSGCCCTPPPGLFKRSDAP
jgi:arylsulfatase A-like enzyme